jgi:nucleoside-diphosphate-sugar epimerase
MGDIFQENEGEFAAVVNLAARAGVRESTEDPWIYVDTNTNGTLNLLDLCREHDVETCVIASTSSLYADSGLPYTEEAEVERPLSPYAASKKGAEAMAASYAQLYGLDTPIPRYFTVYGPAGRPGMAMFRFVRWILEGEPITVYGDGSQRRDFTYVDDIARGTLAALEKIDGFDIVNLGNDSPVELMQLIRTIEEVSGEAAEIQHEARHPADVDATWADIQKARTQLDWEPKTSLEDGVAKTVSWYKEERSWASSINLGAV